MSISWWKGVVILALVAAGFYAVRTVQAERQARVLAELQLSTERQINDSTVARLAVETADKDSLSAALDAANTLNGKLIAAAKIRVQKRDTVVHHDTIFTKTTEDSTRIAHFRDSTFAGTIAGTVTAPPCCQPLGITYQLTRPAFSPTIAFVEVAGKTVATVTWNGEHASIESPYAKAPSKKLHFLGAWAEGNWRFLNGNKDLKDLNTLEINGGALLRLNQTLNIHAGASTDAVLFAGVRKEF